MSAYTAICAHLLFPLHERIKGHQSVAVRRRLERSQWLPADALEQQRVARLRDFLVDVGRQVPYYRTQFEHLGFDPAKLSSLSDLQRLPLLAKADIRAHQQALKADDHGPLARFNTGGSSGEPLVFFMGKGRTSHDVGAKWRATRWWGVDIGDTELVVWGSPIELGAQDRLRRLRDGVMRSHLLPAFEMSETKLDGFVATLRARRPRMLFGYPSALALIARYAERRGQRLDNIGVKVAFVTSERLYDDQRATISRVFGCRVANGYGGRDAGFIAHECPEGGMHLMAEDIIVELIDAEGRAVPAGEPGEIVVTHMATRDFPFVRYRTGDVAVMDNRACACGRGLPMLREIQGRTTDFVIAGDGTVLHGLSLIYIVRDLAGVQSFKVVQESLSLTRLMLVVDASFDRSKVAQIVTGFKQRLGQQVRVEVEFVDRIPAERSGKFRYIVSHAVAPREGAASHA